MLDELSDLKKDYDLDDPKEVDEHARRLVELAKLDDEGCRQTPDDFEECVELVKRKVLLPEPTYGPTPILGRLKELIPGIERGKSEFDEELDDLIFRRIMMRLEIENGVKWEIEDDS